ncbi:hypothetical protein WN72_05765 [Bradyrhizobium arachidis]|uniref:Uncharacterized protein n=1 Tax=Bradyrhizobium arachidis TaxID=858423 RepID=A0AAE7NI25_9BRAD|nr:hypothetical protein WN72_05765 [Bradyrhizobium arachidis]
MTEARVGFEPAHWPPYMLIETMAIKPAAAVPHASACNIHGRMVMVASRQDGRMHADCVRYLR